MAIKLMPNDNNAYIHYFYFELRLCDCEKMIAIRDQYKWFWEEVDQPLTSYSLLILLCQKKYSEIAKSADKYWNGDIYMHQAYPIFFSYLILKEYSKAERVVIYTKEHFKLKSIYYIFNGILKAKQGNVKATMAMCDSLRNLSGSEYIANAHFAAIYAALGNKMEMYKYLNMAILSRESLSDWMNMLPDLVPCKDDPEYKKITREMWIPREAD